MQSKTGDVPSYKLRHPRRNLGAPAARSFGAVCPGDTAKHNASSVVLTLSLHGHFEKYLLYFTTKP